MNGFIRSQLSFDFLDYHTCSALVAEDWLAIMHKTWFGMSSLNALPFPPTSMGEVRFGR